MRDVYTVHSHYADLISTQCLTHIIHTKIQLSLGEGGLNTATLKTLLLEVDYILSTPEEVIL